MAIIHDRPLDRSSSEPTAPDTVREAQPSSNDDPALGASDFEYSDISEEEE
jgi:hypothetical protein